MLEEVRGACEMLGLEPAYVANEGRFIAIVASSDAKRALEIMCVHPLGEGATAIGSVADASDALVTSRSAIGIRRIIDKLSGEQLPRIC